MLLEEVPGAMERPGDCRIRVEAADEGREVTITVPPQALPWILTAGAVLLAANLLVMAYTGAMLFGSHRSVLLMSQIAPHDLPVPMHRWQGLLVAGWLALEGLGLFALLTTVRPALLQEVIVIGQQGVWRRRRMLGRRTMERIARENVRGFHLERDPLDMTGSVLSIQGGDVELTVAEYVSEADREWLLSVGNALLRRV